MKTMTLGFWILMVAIVAAAGHVETRRPVPAGRGVAAGLPAPSIPPSAPIPTSAPAGVEVLLLVR